MSDDANGSERSAPDPAMIHPAYESVVERHAPKTGDAVADAIGRSFIVAACIIASALDELIDTLEE